MSSEKKLVKRFEVLGTEVAPFECAEETLEFNSRRRRLFEDEGAAKKCAEEAKGRLKLVQIFKAEEGEVKGFKVATKDIPFWVERGAFTEKAAAEALAEEQRAKLAEADAGDGQAAKPVRKKTKVAKKSAANAGSR